MLFDLRSRGRRTTVRIVYIGLALLIGIGLVGFGVGGGFGGGGLLSAATNAESSSSGSSYAKKVAHYEKLIRKEPSNVANREALIHNLLLEAGGEAFKASGGGLTSSGKKAYNRVAQAWSSYAALKPAKPNVSLAKQMLLIFGEEGLNESNSAVEVLELIVSAEPTSDSYYGFLAEYAYKAHNYTLGDLAAGKAVALAPAGQSKVVKNRLEEIKKAIQKQEKEGSSSSSSSSTARSSSSEGTVTTTAPSTSSGKSRSAKKKAKASVPRG